MTNSATAAISIRPAQAGDSAIIARLLYQLGYEASAEQIQQRLQALASSPTDEILVAIINETVVGSISLHALPMFHMAGKLGRITSMVVDEGQRSSGIGGALIAAAEHWFAAAGCVKLEVTSSDHRTATHRFYEREGFARDGQRFTRKVEQ